MKKWQVSVNRTTWGILRLATTTSEIDPANSLVNKTNMGTWLPLDTMSAIILRQTRIEVGMLGWEANIEEY